MGPTTIFDKSALQSLSMDEAVWFDQFLTGNITPLFYVETLADLEKLAKDGRTPEDVVGNMAAKTPSDAFPNVHHMQIVLAELAGHKHDIRGVPVVAGGKPKQTPDGKLAIHFEEFPEMAAFSRWHNGDFLGVERGIAKVWRQQLANQDIDIQIARLRNILPINRNIPTIESLKEFIDSFCHDSSKPVLDLLMDVLAIPSPGHSMIIGRWEKLGRPLIDEFAPYATHVFKVELLYYLGIHKGFISGVRKSNKADMAYLYYLPFCMVFVSGDNLHTRTVPLFLSDTQTYLTASDLKKSLNELNEHYKKLPEEIKAIGVMQFCSYPPSMLNNRVTQLWDKHMRPDWREIAKGYEDKIFDPVARSAPKGSAKDIIQSMEESVPLPEDSRANTKEADQVFIQRFMPARKGSWQMFSKEVLEAGKKRENHEHK